MENNGPIIDTPFINIQSDYGFKRTFGTEEFKLCVVRLLEAAFGDELSVTSVSPYKGNLNPEYQNKEILPPEEDGKRILYDVYFKVKTKPGQSSFKPNHLQERKDPDVEHHFILEMQNAYEPPFEERMVHYASRIIADQGKRGWDYDLDPVILIAVTDFDLPRLKPKMVQEFELREKETGEILTEKLRMLFYSLKRVPKEWDDCETELQRRLYLIKNMDKMDKNSKPYLEGGYEDMFDAAESTQIVGDAAVAYSQSLAAMRSHQAGLQYSFDKGMEKGMEKGIEKGMEKGRKEGMVEIARNLLRMGMGVEFVSRASGLSSAEIASL